MSKVDYSKWDNIELSDDEDIECHPNIDKASFIRWKQADIHRKREERKLRIMEYKQELETNVKLRELLVEYSQLEKGKTLETKMEKLFEQVDLYEKTRKQVLLNPDSEEFMKVSGLDEVFSMLISRLADENKLEKRPEAFIEQMKSIIIREIPKLDKRQEELKKLIATEENEQNKKLTSDNMYHDGFSKTILNSKAEAKSNSKQAMVKKEIEVLNPNFKEHEKKFDSVPSSGEEKDLSLEEEKLLLKIIKLDTFEDVYDLIRDNSFILRQKFCDELMARAFKLQVGYEKSLLNKIKAASVDREVSNCTKWSLAISYCLQMGYDGVSLFFKRMQSTAPRQVFEQDFHSTLDRIQTRSKELALQYSTTHEDKEFDESNSNLTPEQAKVFKTFDKFFQDALISGDINKINEAFSKMDEEKSKEVMEQCQACGLISVLSEEEAKKLVEDEEESKKKILLK